MTERRRYHFASAAQWSTGLRSRATLAADGSFAPVAPWAAGTVLQASAGRAASIAPEGTAYWNDGAQRLWQAEPDAAESASHMVPAALAGATRLAAGRTQLWACDARPVLLAYLRDPPVLRLRIAIDAERIVDLATDGIDGVWVLAMRSAQAVALHVDCSGQLGRCVGLPSICGAPIGLAWVPDRLVVLDAGGTELSWIDPRQPGATMTMSLRPARPGGHATVIGSDARRRIVVGGVDDTAFGGGAWIIDCDADAELLGSIALADAPLSIACGADQLVVTTALVVWRFGLATAADARRSEASASFVTPVLFSPPSEGRAPWLRAELRAMLPPGCSVEIAQASSDDADQLAAVRALLAQAGLAPAVRRQRLDALLSWSAPMHFTRVEGSADDAVSNCVLPLHELRARWLWIAVGVIAAPGAAAPRALSLDVLYPDESLMQYLPAIYRRQAEQPGDFLRTLVAALETSVHGLDDRIATLGRLLDPTDSPAPWLDAIARWLGIPWDDTLDLATKRALLAAAPALLEQRGTRAGLRALLAALLPAGRARIVDIGVQYGFARLAGVGELGVRLPALLAGWPCDAMVLNAKACIGLGRLADPTRAAIDTATWLAGRVEIEITTTPAEQRAWSPWLRPLLDVMTPLTARLRLRWIATTAPPAIPVLDATLSLEADPSARLGESATLGRSRLDGRRGTTLDGAGTAPDFRLY